MDKLRIFWLKIKPRYYKKTFYLGKLKIIKFTQAGVGEFFHKILWALIVIVMLVAMFLGGLAITQSQNTTSTVIQTIPSN